MSFTQQESVDPASKSGVTTKGQAEERPDPRLEKQRGTRRPTGVIFTVDRALLEGLRRSQQELHNLVHGYVYSSDLLSHCITFRKRVKEAKQDAPVVDGGYSLFKQLARDLDKAEKSSQALSGTGVLENEVANVANALGALRRQAPQPDGDLVDDLADTLDQLDRALDDMDMEFRIRSISIECAKGATEQLETVEGVVGDIFNNVRTNIGNAEEQKRREPASSEEDESPPQAPSAQKASKSADQPLENKPERLGETITHGPRRGRNDANG